MPDRVTAGWNQLLPIALAGRDPRNNEQFVVFTVFQRGGAGAKHGADGWPMIGSPAALQMRSPDPEMFELTTPHVLEYCEFDPDSAGPGRWRGGFGLRSAFRTYGEPEHGTTFGDDIALEGATPPPGLFGGHPGGLNTLRVEFPDGRTAGWGSKEHQADLTPGTRVIATNGGGAGYGDPHERPADLVLSEVRDGLVSPESARADYGVAIDTERWVVLEEETRALRTAGGTKA
jgi:N-methylhydantoinase B